MIFLVNHMTHEMQKIQSVLMSTQGVEGRMPIRVDGRGVENYNVSEEDVPLISVIVPIYNVEKYVRKCLDSLKNQTMKQIEVICIDDGSADESGKIADEYVSDEWPIFRVIHTENRGLSAARNRGIDEARAEWLMFVDSDDWVEQDFCRIPYETAIENQADMVIFQAVTEKNGKIIRSKQLKRPVGIVDEQTAHEYGCPASWNKLYMRGLFDDIYYPEGRVFEDLAITHKLIHNAKKMLMLRQILYHHVYRKGSITHQYNTMNKKDGFVLALERKNELISYGYPKEKLEASVCAAAISYLACTKIEDDAYEKAVTIVESTDGVPDSLSKKQKIALRTWKISRMCFYLLSRIAGRKKN